METQKENPLESHRSTSPTRHHHHLPQEIVEQIMIKLPTKSILRFKCVSKSWRSLASSDRFVKAHLEESSKDKSLERYHIVFGSSRRGATMQEFSLPSFLHGAARARDYYAAADFHFPTCGSTDSASIVGYCNGLVCVLKNLADFILWNPTTRKFKTLPLSEGGSRYFVDAYGFGFDESNNDYKVFGLWSSNTQQRAGRKRWAKTYSLKTGSWRIVDDPMLDRDCGFYSPTGRFASGKLHWEACDGGRRIIYFDLRNETFGTVGWPSSPKVRCGWWLSYVIEGCLCCFSPVELDHIDYWVLKEGSRRWHKLATLGRPCLVPDEIRRGDEYFYPLFVCPGGHILAQHNRSIVIFVKELNGGGWRFPKVLYYGALFCHRHTSIYVESLVEP